LHFAGGTALNKQKEEKIRWSDIKKRTKKKGTRKKNGIRGEQQVGGQNGEPPRKKRRKELATDIVLEFPLCNGF